MPNKEDNNEPNDSETDELVSALEAELVSAGAENASLTEQILELRKQIADSALVELTPDFWLDLRVVTSLRYTPGHFTAAGSEPAKFEVWWRPGKLRLGMEPAPKAVEVRVRSVRAITPPPRVFPDMESFRAWVGTYKETHGPAAEAEERVVARQMIRDFHERRKNPKANPNEDRSDPLFTEATLLAEELREAATGRTEEKMEAILSAPTDNPGPVAAPRRSPSP